jgi:putative SOS response-associated peptidase YedK
MLNERRCIIPASSFFEWKKTASGPKPKYRLTAKGRHLLGMAGVWQPWQNPKTGQWEPTFAIITSDPNKKMTEIHDRQPVILDLKEYAEWLGETERLPLHLLRVLQDDDMVIDPVVVRAEEKAEEPPQLGLFGAV